MARARGRKAFGNSADVNPPENRAESPYPPLKEGPPRSDP